jgi:hypothetical protein
MEYYEENKFLLYLDKELKKFNFLKNYYIFYLLLRVSYIKHRGHRDRKIVWFTTTYAISAYHH